LAAFTREVVVSWNYRVLKFIDDPDPEKHHYAIHEVYYPEDDAGVVNDDLSNPATLAQLAWTERAIGVRGDTPQEVRDDLAYHERALDHDVVLIKDGAVVGTEPWVT
jgi:hypothetical protein